MHRQPDGRSVTPAHRSSGQQLQPVSDSGDIGQQSQGSSCQTARDESGVVAAIDPFEDSTGRGDQCEAQIQAFPPAAEWAVSGGANHSTAEMLSIALLQQQLADLGKAFSHQRAGPTSKCGNARVKICWYDGSSSLEPNLVQFEAVNLATALEGAAREVLLDIPSTGPAAYDTLLVALRCSLRDCTSTLSQRDLLHNQIHSSGEQLGVLAAEIQRLATRAYTDMAAVSVQSLTLEAFLRALQPIGLRQLVRLACPTTLDDATAKTEEVEAILQEGVPANRSRSAVWAAGLPEEEEPATVNAARGQGPLVCWAWGQRGHIQHNCRQKPASGASQPAVGKREWVSVKGGPLTAIPTAPKVRPTTISTQTRPLLTKTAGADRDRLRVGRLGPGHSTRVTCRVQGVICSGYRGDY